jgi:hypothetical protein
MQESDVTLKIPDQRFTAGFCLGEIDAIRANRLLWCRLQSEFGPDRLRHQCDVVVHQPASLLGRRAMSDGEHA